MKSRRLRTILQYAFGAFVTLLVISVITFAATNLTSPETIARERLGKEVTQQQIDAFVRAHGLSDPVYTRYFQWLAHTVQGNLGLSVSTDQSVASVVVPRLTRTAILTAVSILVAVLVSIYLAVFTATHIGGRLDFVFLVGTGIIAALPEFVVGIGLLWLLAVWLGWFPIDSSALTFPASFGTQLKAYALPVLTLVIVMVPYIGRIGRASMREALTAPYIQAAVLRGLPRRMVVYDHALRNAAAPLVNAIAINIVYMLGGVIVIENLFAFPGLGQGLVQALSTTDTTTVQAIVLVMGGMFICLSLSADLVVAYLNPRLKASR